VVSYRLLRDGALMAEVGSDELDHTLYLEQTDGVWAVEARDEAGNVAVGPRQHWRDPMTELPEGRRSVLETNRATPPPSVLRSGVDTSVGIELRGNWTLSHERPARGSGSGLGFDPDGQGEGSGDDTGHFGGSDPE
jgi:hypothetical protein